MSEPTAPKIEFPCPYRIRVVANAVDGLSSVDRIVRKHAQEFDESTLDMRPAKAVNTTLTAKSWRPVSQFDLFEGAKATGNSHGAVKQIDRGRELSHHLASDAGLGRLGR